MGSVESGVKDRQSFNVRSSSLRGVEHFTAAERRPSQVGERMDALNE